MTFPTTLSKRNLPVGEQAHALRSLMHQLQSSRLEALPRPREGRAVAVGVTSGKGGVGKTNIALALGIALGRLNAATCVIDANLGLGNIDLLCGLNGYWNLAHVITGARHLQDIVLAGPEAIAVIPGASGLVDLANCPAEASADVCRQLEEFEAAYDFLIIDTAAGIHRSARAFLDACDLVLVVTTPEPTSVADAYSTLKALSTSGIPHVEVLVNQCESEQQARVVVERIQQTARLFLRMEVEDAGCIPKDPRVASAVAHRRPFVIESPDSPATTAISEIAQRLKRLFDAQPRRGPFFPRMHQLGMRGTA